MQKSNRIATADDGNRRGGQPGKASVGASLPTDRILKGEMRGDAFLTGLSLGGQDPAKRRNLGVFPNRKLSGRMKVQGETSGSPEGLGKIRQQRIHKRQPIFWRSPVKWSLKVFHVLSRPQTKSPGKRYFRSSAQNV